MNARVRRMGLVIVVCFAALLIQMMNIQVRQASALDANPLNQLGKPSPFFQPRGEIVSADGTVLAYSKASKDEYRYLRVYPPATAQLFSAITGYYATAVQADIFGVEASYNQYLEQHESPVKTLGDLLSQHEETDNVVLTVSDQLQTAAMQALDSAPDGQSGGAVIALDPRTGAILAFYSNPSYDPNQLAAHDPKAVNALVNQYNSEPSENNPLVDNAIATLHPPGSTFKVLTTSAVYDHDHSIASQTFPVESEYPFPGSGNPPSYMHNYDDEACGGDLAQALAQSCDTTFSQIGEELGGTALASEAQSFGFGKTPPIDIPGAVASQFPQASSLTSSGLLANSAIGQGNDNATLLQMALVASGIADGGTVMTPHVVSKAVSTSDGTTEFTYQPHPWLQATSSSTATTVRQLMTGVTQNPLGTAYTLFQGYYSSGYPVVAAKTGTAQPGDTGCGTYNWLVAMAPAAAGQTPSVVVAAMVPVLSSASCGINPTGASVAGPVALAVLEAALKAKS